MSENARPYFGSQGEMIRGLRKQKGITIVELAEKMGVSQAYISRVERGEVIPTKEQVEIIKSFIERRE